MALIGLVGLPEFAGADPILQFDSASHVTMKLTAATAGQGIRPIVQQRGVNLDGSVRSVSTHAWAFHANPYEAGATGGRLGDLMLATGAYSPTEVDIALPAPGVSRVVIGRSFNQVQHNGSSHVDSAGYQGYNWFQTSQPEIALYDADTNPSTRQVTDILYVVYGADRFLEFTRTAANEDTFRGNNGAAGIITFVAGTPDVYIWTDQRGTQTYFFGDDTTGDHGDWQFWKTVDPAGNVAYVGDSTTAATAVTNGYNNRMIQLLYDGAGRRYCYTYTSNMLTQVLVETDAGGGWGSCGTETMVGKVEYAYYGSSETHGSLGDLKLVTLTTPMTDSGVNQVKKKYYRYWKGAYNGSTVFGSAHTLKMVVGFEGCRNFDWTWGNDGLLDDDFLNEADGDLKPFSDAYFECVSGSDYRIAKAIFNGQCGCGGGSNNGEHLFTYANRGGFVPTSGSYDVGWRSRVIIDPPSGGTWVTQYFDECSQPLGRVLTDGNPAAVSPPSQWVTEVVRNGSGMVEQTCTPASITGYTHSTGAITVSTSAGLIWLHERVSGGSDVDGFLQGMRQQEGTTTISSTSNYVNWTSYATRDHNITGSIDVTRPMVSARRAFHTATTNNADSTKYDETAMAYAWWSSTASSPLYITLKQITTTNPIVATANNGSNSATVFKSYHRKDSTVAFTETPLVRFDYTQYTNGQLTKRQDDAKTNGSFPSGDDPNTDFGITETGDGWNRTTTYTYDTQGRMDTMTASDGRISKNYYSRLSDQRGVAIAWPRMTTGGSTTYFGPASYSVLNQTGKADVRGSIAIASAGLTDALTTWIDEGDPDPITALDKGTLARMATKIHNGPGSRVDASRAYHLIPASGAGSSGTNYDATVYGFDDVGRPWRTKAATGTITRTAFDGAGRTFRRYIGTNDNGWTGGETSGTDNMVKVEELEYDANADDGNSHNTQRTVYVEDSTTDQRVSTYLFDYRGRMIVALPPLAPFSVSKFDNLSRPIAVGQYSSNSGLDASDDPVTLDTNRTALSETKFDDLGRVCRTTRHEIVQADGSSNTTLTSETWRDADGRVVKVDGEQLSKMLYDRLGRATHQFTLAKDDDSSAYAAADDVSGDIVLEENQTTFESSDSDNVMMRASIARFHDDLASGTTGALDTNADANTFKYTAADVNGRIQITSMWYDDLDRAIDVVAYGTNGGSTFDRKPSGTFLTVPIRSANELRISTTYSDDGTVLQIEDPKGIKTRYAYDGAGRKVTETRNYINGIPTGGSETATDDVTTRFEYSKGLQTKIWVDFDADGVVDISAPKDQVTSYIYGTTKDTSTPDAHLSRIATGHLLRAILYPDTTNTGVDFDDVDADATDVVSFAYNAQSQQVYVSDQDANVIQTTFDTLGRDIHRRVTTIGAGFDNAVLRISKTYLTRGLLSKVTQYSSATVGSGSVTDDVKYAYDGWGNITSFKQDADSDLDVSPSGIPATDTIYTWAKNITGRNTLRKTAMGYANVSLTYSYASAGNSLANDASRVSSLSFADGVVTLTDAGVYTYNGVGQLVGTDLAEPDVRNLLYEGASSGSYPDLDNFNRPVQSRWTKYGISPTRDFVDLDLTYDENSNILTIKDNVATTNAGVRRFDMEVEVDNLNRVVQVEEGELSGTSIATMTRQEHWKDGLGNIALTQTGNWNNYRLDLNGNGAFNNAGELDELRTHTIANEITTQEPDGANPPLYTHTHDGNGNQTDDGQHYNYKYDAFGRLREVKNRTTPFATVAQYRYNGLGFRISWKYDTDVDGDVDGSDLTFYFQHDPEWRQLATYRSIDANAKETFVYHMAGLSGRGGSSYIDSVMMRNKDLNTAWLTASDGSLEERRYHALNWRADVSAILTDTGKLMERVKYTTYGIPIGLPAGDTDSDGDWDTNDAGNIAGSGGYVLQQDADLSGAISASDTTQANLPTGGFQTLGRGRLSSTGIANRMAYAGYQYDPTLATRRHLSHVRNRVFDAALGRWLRRDPIGYVEVASLYTYVNSRVIDTNDPSGLAGCRSTGSSVTDGDFGLNGVKITKCNTIFYTVIIPDFQPNPDPASWEECSGAGVIVKPNQTGANADCCNAKCDEYPLRMGMNTCCNGEHVICMCPNNPKVPTEENETPVPVLKNIPKACGVYNCVLNQEICISWMFKCNGDTMEGLFDACSEFQIKCHCFDAQLKCMQQYCNANPGCKAICDIYLPSFEAGKKHWCVTEPANNKPAPCQIVVPQ